MKELFDRILQRLRRKPRRSIILVQTPVGCPSIFYEEWLRGEPPQGFTTRHFQCEYPPEEEDEGWELIGTRADQLCVRSLSWLDIAQLAAQEEVE